MNRSDETEIHRSLNVLFEPPSVIELRVIQGRRVEVGYFLDRHALVNAAARFDSDAAIYVTMNEINPALLARSRNRIRQGIPATADTDVLHRRWLLVDLDPRRPSGISATDGEHAAAHARAGEIRDFLVEQGWPEPVVADSGNGGHLLYRISLPNDAEADGLAKCVLEALDFMFSSEVVKIDTSVHNAGRITKLYGTLAVKGDPTPERPYRRSRLLHVPDPVLVVGNALLSGIAAMGPPNGRSPNGAEQHRGFDLDAFIHRAGLQVAFESPWQDGRRIVLATCPWNPGHTNRSAYIVRFPNGAIAAGCHHQSCQGKSWKDLRARSDTSAPVEETPVWTPPIDFDELRHGPRPPLDALPAVLADMIRETSRAVQISEAFVAGGVLGVVFAAAGRRARVQVSDGHTETLAAFFGLVAESGERKMILRTLASPLLELERDLAEAVRPEVARRRQEREALQRRIQELQRRAGKEKSPAVRRQLINEATELDSEMPPERFLPQLVIDDVTSEAAARVLSQQNGVAAVVSEEGGSIVEIWAGRYSRTKPASNIDLYLKAYDGGLVRVHRVSRDPIDLRDPCLNITLALQPIVLARIASDAEFRGRGLVARFCFVCGESMVGARRNQIDPIDAIVTARYAKVIKAIGSLPVAESGDVPLIRFTSAGWEIWNQYAAEVERAQLEGEELEEFRDWASKHAGRAARIAAVFHLIRHLEAEGDPFASPVSAEDIVSGWAIAQWLQQHQRAAFEAMMLDPASALAQRVLGRLRKERMGSFTKRDAFNSCRRRVDFGSRATHFDGALDVLVERGFIRPLGSEPPGMRAGRPPSQRFNVNPYTHNPQNPQKSESGEFSPNSADSADSAGTQP